MFNRESWDFQHELYNKYGQVVKADALFGVCVNQTDCGGYTAEDCQNKWLFVFDPLALHHVVLKDQHIYEETEQFIQCVFLGIRLEAVW